MRNQTVKNKKGNLLMTAGLLLILAALLLTVYNIWDENRAADSAQDIVTKLKQDIDDDGNDDYLKYPEMEMPVKEIDGHECIGLLEIPSVGLSLPVLSEWSLPLLKISPCRYTGSAYTGDLIIAGHNYRRHFGVLKQLGVGDSVTFTDVEGHIFQYKVSDIEVLDGTAVEEMQFGGGESWDLTLFTCTYGGKTRLTVRCVEE